ncbi:flagellar biosynthesis protein FlhF [Bacillus tianshenii]|nr:flagellar biosynthesis protein FlhF [Bacillus tianshenii]
MKVKKFIAPSMPEAMKKVRAELGKDAVILNSKVINKGGLFGLFAKKNIEVIAAIDPEGSSSPKQTKKIVVPKEENRIPLPKQPEYLKSNSSPDLMKEIQELKSMMESISSDNSGVASHYPAPVQTVYRLLSEQDVNPHIRDELISSLMENWYLHKGDAVFDEVYNWLIQRLEEKFSNLSFGPVKLNRKYTNVVGPTGVGKTTTLAKMAAYSVLKENKKCAFITTDTYRIAAVEQLKTYAKILDIPLEVAYTIDDFRKAKEKFAEYDKVFIDTAGRNFRNKEYIKDLKSVVDFDKEMETYLVLALTAKDVDMERIFEQFKAVTIDRLIFTKVDETEKYGSLINLPFKHAIGVAYVTNGQNVPDDIKEASPRYLINQVFGVDRYEGSS